VIEFPIHLPKLKISQMLRATSTQVARVTSVLAELYAAKLIETRFSLLKTFRDSVI